MSLPTPRGLVIGAALVCAFTAAACSSTETGKEISTPTSIGDPAVAEQVEDLESALITSSDLPGDYAQVAEVSFGEFGLCGQDLLAADPPAGRLAVAFGNPEENLVLENLLVFTDSDAAGAFMSNLAEEARGCKDQSSGESPATVTVMSDPEIGDRSEAVGIEGRDSSGKQYSADMIIAQSGNVVAALSGVNLAEPHIETALLENAAAEVVDRIQASQGG